MKAQKSTPLPPKPSGVGTNQIVDELHAIFNDRTMYPTGIAAAIITNDLKAASNSAPPFVTWAEIVEAVRYIHTWIPTSKVVACRRKLSKGGAS